jgi:regulator of replication initiation timing
VDDQDIKLLEEKLDSLVKYCEALRLEKQDLRNRLNEATAALDKMREERNSIRERVVTLVDKIDRLGDMAAGSIQGNSAD